MLAILAFVFFVMAAILNFTDSTYVHVLGLVWIGLALLALHFVAPYTPWTRPSNTPPS